MAFYSEEMKNRLYMVKSRIVSTHKHCGGTGITQTESEISECICMKVFRYVKALIVARIPRSYWTLSLNKLTKIEIAYRKFIKMYLDKFDNAIDRGLGIFFLGVNGIGKTALACEIAKYAIIEQKGVRYVTAQYYIDLLMKQEEHAVDVFANKDVVVFDELDKAYIKEGSTFVPKKIEDFLRRTLSAGTIVILCTNMNEDSEDRDEETIQTTFGDSLLSMLKRQIKFVHMDGEDVSDMLHDKWAESLNEEYNYFDPQIVTMAKAYDRRRGEIG